MKGSSHPRNDVTLNPSGNRSIQDIIDAVDTSRRQFVKGGASAVALASAGGLTLGGLVGAVQATPSHGDARPPGIGFTCPAWTAKAGPRKFCSANSHQWLAFSDQ